VQASVGIGSEKKGRSEKETKKSTRSRRRRSATGVRTVGLLF
jgi:hypothetical protein